MGGDRSSPEFQFAQPNGRNKLRAVAQHAACWTRKRPIPVTRPDTLKQPPVLALASQWRGIPALRTGRQLPESVESLYTLVLVMKVDRTASH